MRLTPPTSQISVHNPTPSSALRASTSRTAGDRDDALRVPSDVRVRAVGLWCALPPSRPRFGLLMSSPRSRVGDCESRRARRRCRMVQSVDLGRSDRARPGFVPAAWRRRASRGRRVPRCVRARLQGCGQLLTPRLNSSSRSVRLRGPERGGTQSGAGRVRKRHEFKRWGWVDGGALSELDYGYEADC